MRREKVKKSILIPQIILITTLALISIVTIATTNVYASLSVVDNFDFRISEDMVALFVEPGATSADFYQNLVRVQISGTGQQNGSIVNDAFYYLNPF